MSVIDSGRAGESRRRFLRDFIAMSGWVFLSGAEILRSTPAAVAGDKQNADKAWGGLKGRILFDAEPPARKEVDLEKAGVKGDDLKWFTSMGTVVNQDWVIDPKSRAVQWVFVWLIPEDPKGNPLGIHESLKAVPDKEKVVTVDQSPLGYEPHAVAVRAGQDLLMKNTGPVPHVFKFVGSENPEMNQAMPSKAEIKVPNLLAERNAVQISCPPHPWERLWLRIYDHPYFAVTKADGTFEIKLAPAGKCRLVVWQESLGFKDGKAGRNGSVVTVEGAATTDLGDIKIKPLT
jgi:plastocyanin